MKRFIHTTCALTLSIWMLVTPATAQDDGLDGKQDAAEGLSLIEEGAKLFMRGMIKEMEPALDDLQLFGEKIEPKLKVFLDEMGPALAELIGKIDDITAYQAPEMLPNGDIIIRRKIPRDPKSEAEKTPDDTNPAGEEIDL
ncbi:hypothetical protein [Rhodalgimonas zhirmunskyi]|uniref:AAA+ family ATPase n=1 Tax=Rhodalgimonas zhirmunskyi TaxID=2964767 RepID=A0AAJ1U849_9RHOB|nr:hypothetical protein [Rhodoalgimonas zhirmunskyi]MDQ2092878.1 hypothetical protein [Rhodoalgimonas zhirmunskyi]